MGETIDIFSLSGMKFPIYILASTFSTVSLELCTQRTHGIYINNMPHTVFRADQFHFVYAFPLSVYFFQSLLLRSSLPPRSHLLVMDRFFSGQTVVQVWQRIHSVERILPSFFKYSGILISMGHARVHALHSLHFSLSPSILYRANLELILRMVVMGQRYLQNALLSVKARARIIPEAK